MNFELLNSISCNEIIPNLTVGNAATAKNKEFDLIINCTNNINYKSKGIIMRIPIDDLPEDSDILMTYLPTIIENIHNFLKKQKTVLVHCSMGVSRSCTVIAAYLIKYFVNVRSVDEIISFIKEKRKEAFLVEVRFRLVLEKCLEIKKRELMNKHISFT